MNDSKKSLTEAFNASKTSRNVLSKQIIWESGVSKSQFYRIIRGQETPSPETKTRIAKALNLEVDEFDLLHRRTNVEAAPHTSAPKTRRLAMLAGLVISALLTTSIMALNMNEQPTNTTATGKVVTHPDDSTLFVMDVTIPDGMAIPIDTTYVKTWRVKNTGKVAWKYRYLKRITPPSPQVCSSPAMVPIAETLPGETVDISVTFTTPHLPGSCRTDWKSADENGDLHFPDMHGLFSIVTVTE